MPNPITQAERQSLPPQSFVFAALGLQALATFNVSEQKYVLREIWLTNTDRSSMPACGPKRQIENWSLLCSVGGKTGPSEPRQAQSRKFAAHLAHNDENFNRNPQPFQPNTWDGWKIGFFTASL